MMGTKALSDMKRYCMVLVLIFALALVFSPIVLIALAEQENTKEAEKTACTACVVDARNCPGYNKIMYGVVSFREVWNGSEFVPQKVCIVKDDDGKISVWSFEQPRFAIVSEIDEVVENESTEEQAAEEKPAKTTAAPKKISGLIAKIKGPEKAATKEEKPAKTTAVPKKISGLIARIEGPERAATKEEIAAEEELMLEITGLIIEETMTRIGYEFYEYFFLFWEAPEVEVKDYNILISEFASPIWGSWVKVNIDGTTVWSKMLKPRSEEIEDAVKQAVEATKQYLYNYEQYQFQTEDMVGTGI